MGKAREASGSGSWRKEFANCLYWVPREDHRRGNSEGGAGSTEPPWVKKAETAPKQAVAGCPDPACKQPLQPPQQRGLALSYPGYAENFLTHFLDTEGSPLGKWKRGFFYVILPCWAASQQ